jgi:hypothetical protein
MPAYGTHDCLIGRAACYGAIEKYKYVLLDLLVIRFHWEMPKFVYNDDVH